MKIAYASLTNKTKIFANKLQQKLISMDIKLDFIKINKSTVIDEPFVLITYTFGHGEVPKVVESFLDNTTNKNNIVAVAGAGDKSWGIDRYNKASIIISEQLNIPLLHKFEKQGFDKDVQIVADKVAELLE